MKNLESFVMGVLSSFKDYEFNKRFDCRNQIFCCCVSYSTHTNGLPMLIVISVDN